MLQFHAFSFTFFLVSQLILCYFYHIVSFKNFLNANAVLFEQKK